METGCPLCSRAREGVFICENLAAVAFYDGYPVSRGHSLVVPRRHVADLFCLPAEEQQALWALLPMVKEALDRVHRPAGYNLGVNVGEAAGQTIAHVHVHVIPRYHGDVPDPRGGVRWVIPDRANYWSAR
ncbi:MAG: HIT family protein [Acidobacteria bacterium]|nr:MAG: HIT family protein [Acidobacteriota bacterium]